MLGQRRLQAFVGLFVLALIVGLVSRPATADADPPRKKTVKKKRVEREDGVKQRRPGHEGLEKQRPAKEGAKKKRVTKRGVTQQKSRAVSARRPERERVRTRRTYVPTRRDYRHVRVTRYPRHDNGRLNVRPIMIRSARVSPVLLNRFEDRRRGEIRLVVQHLREGRRARALEIWGGFVDSLCDYHEPIDLDEVMLYVAREGCFREDDAFLFHALKLEFLRESQERLEDYMDQLYEQREACLHGARSCSSATLRDLETELARARADRDILAVEARAANERFESITRSSGEYEHRFAAIFEDMYREVEVRVRFSP